MAERERLIGTSAQLIEGGDGLRFDWHHNGVAKPAFAVRYLGVVRAYLNQCAHVPVQLDWQPGKFFDLGTRYLICAVHGAHYLPESGYCVMGPCRGRALRRVPVCEREGSVFVIETAEPADP